MKDFQLDKQILDIAYNLNGSVNSGKGKWTYFQKHYPDLYEYLKTRFVDIDETYPIKEFLYRLKNSIETKPICPVCGKEILFDGRKYPVFCSADCMYTDKGKSLINQRKKETNIKKYGVENPLTLPEIQQKAILTNQKKFGVDRPAQCPEIADKISKSHSQKSAEEKMQAIQKCKQTKLNRYGDENYVNADKRRETCKERYNVDNPMQCPEIKEKAQKTCHLHFGVDNPGQSEEVKLKIKNTCQIKHGIDYVTQTEIQKEKSRQTCNERFGTDYAMQNPEIVKKQKQTCRERYGNENFRNHAAAKQTCMERYNNENYRNIDQMNRTKLERYNNPWYSNRLKYRQTCLNRFNVENPMSVPSIAQKSWDIRAEKGTLYSSKIENDLSDWFTINKVDFVRNYNKDSRYPFHVDFYLTDFDLFIEIQGYWTHDSHPFNIDDINDVQKKSELEKLAKEHSKSYKSKYTDKIQIWTITDPLKRQTAENNNLNFLEIFTDKTDIAKKTINEYLFDIFNKTLSD